jgi:prepilin peptidase CpaA
VDAGGWATSALLLAVAAAAAYTDVRWGRVPNALTYTAALAGVVLHEVVRPSGLGWGTAALGLLTGFVPMLVVYLGGGLHGGDVKLMAAVGAFLGPLLTAYALLYSCLAGAALCLGLILWKEGVGGVILRVGGALRRSGPGDDELPRLRFPFAVAVLAGVAWVVAERAAGTTLVDLLVGSGVA